MFCEFGLRCFTLLITLDLSSTRTLVDALGHPHVDAILLCLSPVLWLLLTYHYS